MSMDENSTEENDLIDDVHQYLTSSKYPDQCSENRKRSIRRKSKKFEVKDGVLHFRKKCRNKVIHTYIICHVTECKINCMGV